MCSCGRREIGCWSNSLCRLPHCLRLCVLAQSCLCVCVCYGFAFASFFPLLRKLLSVLASACMQSAAALRANEYSRMQKSCIQRFVHCVASERASDRVRELARLGLPARASTIIIIIARKGSSEHANGSSVL